MSSVPSGYDPLAIASAAQEITYYRPQTYNRRLVEFCCGRNSRLGRPFPWNDGCDVVRLTLDDDVTTERGLNRAMTAVKRVGSPHLTIGKYPMHRGFSVAEHQREAGGHHSEIGSPPYS